MCTLVIHAAPGPVCAGSYCYNNGTCNATGNGCDCLEQFLQPYCRYRDCEYSILDYSKSCQLPCKSSAKTNISTLYVIKHYFSKYSVDIKFIDCE